MESPWGMNDEQERISKFTDSLAGDIRAAFSDRERYNPQVETHALDKNTGFIIGLNCYDKHSMSVMVSKSRKPEGLLTINRFWGIHPMGTTTGGRESYPEQLRGAADVYDEMTRVLERKFGKPVSEHDGRSIYTTDLKEVIGA